jgi:drug/metabolite transporter (DMT)-like permease
VASTSPILAYAALACAAVCWALGFPFGKIALRHMPVEAMITWRFLIASAFLIPLLFAPAARALFSARRLALLTIAAALFVPIQFIIQFEGLSRTSVSHAALMVALVPAMLAVGSGLTLRRWPNRITTFAIALSVCGAVLVAMKPSRGASTFGDILVLLSLVSGISWVLFTKRYLSDLPAIPSTALMLVLGTCMLAAIELGTHPHDLVQSYPLTSWLPVIGSAILGTIVSTLSWNAGLQHVEPSRAGVFVNIEPIVGSLCGVVFFGDAVTWGLLAGGALVLSGAITVTLQP